jgi:uncharacterized Fe-S cluster-containing MiaB family protein
MECHGRAKCDQTYLSIRQLLLTEQDAVRRWIDRVAALEAQVAALSAEPTNEEVEQFWTWLDNGPSGVRAKLTAFLQRRSQ